VANEWKIAEIHSKVSHFDESFTVAIKKLAEIIVVRLPARRDYDKAVCVKCECVAKPKVEAAARV
jgi:hypothetical protein